MATKFTDDELRIVQNFGHVFVRMLRDKEKTVLDRMYGELRNGETNFLPQMTEYALIRDQIREIEVVLKINDRKSD